TNFALAARVISARTLCGYFAASCTPNMPPSDHPMTTEPSGIFAARSAKTSGNKNGVEVFALPKPGRSNAVTRAVFSNAGRSGCQVRLSHPQPWSRIKLIIRHLVHDLRKGR